jgi:nitrogen fixation protein NifX
VFVLAIGGPAAARVINLKVHPVKLAAVEPITEVISRVQGMLSGNPPPWLRKVMKDESRSMDFLEEDA